MPMIRSNSETKTLGSFAWSIVFFYLSSHLTYGEIKMPTHLFSRVRHHVKYTIIVRYKDHHHVRRGGEAAPNILATSMPARRKGLAEPTRPQRKSHSSGTKTGKHTPHHAAVGGSKLIILLFTRDAAEIHTSQHLHTNAATKPHRSISINPLSCLN